jgi:hypothetical protein
MPNPTIKPLFVAASIIVMFSGLIFIHLENKMLAYTLMFGGAAGLVGFIYAWLTTPLEDEHH